MVVLVGESSGCAWFWRLSPVERHVLRISTPLQLKTCNNKRQLVPEERKQNKTRLHPFKTIPFDTVIRPIHLDLDCARLDIPHPPSLSTNQVEILQIASLGSTTTTLPPNIHLGIESLQHPICLAFTGLGPRKSTSASFLFEFHSTPKPFVRHVSTTSCKCYAKVCWLYFNSSGVAVIISAV